MLSMLSEQQRHYTMICVFCAVVIFYLFVISLVLYIQCGLGDIFAQNAAKNTLTTACLTVAYKR